jgi:hypothetical protein
VCVCVCVWGRGGGGDYTSSSTNALPSTLSLLEYVPPGASAFSVYTKITMSQVNSNVLCKL